MRLGQYWNAYAPNGSWTVSYYIRKWTARLFYRLGRRVRCPSVYTRKFPNREWAVLVRCTDYSGHPGRCRWEEETR